jgi:glycosyltransferase involved in cell wall biosynthesis
MLSFSVLIPSFNSADFLDAALRSLIQQTHSNWECLVIDNYSHDDTEELVRNFRDERIRLIKIHNGGVVAKSRNLGIFESKNDWIAFLDSDDLWFPERLERVAELIKIHDMYDIVSTDEILVDNISNSSSILRYGPACEDFYLDLLLNGNRFSTSAVVIRRQFISEKNLYFSESPAIVTVEDYDLWMQLVNAGARPVFLHLVLGLCRLHKGGLSNDLDRHYPSLRYLLRLHVFRIQSVTLNKDKLWRYVSTRILICESAAHFKQKNYLRGLKTLSLSVLRGRTYFIIYLFRRIERKIDLMSEVNAFN